MCFSPLTGTVTLLRQYLLSRPSVHINTLSLSFILVVVRAECFFLSEQQIQIYTEMMEQKEKEQEVLFGADVGETRRRCNKHLNALRHFFTLLLLTFLW